MFQSLDLSLCQYYNLDSIENAPDQDQVVVPAGLRIIENQSVYTAEDASRLLFCQMDLWQIIN